MFGTAGSMLVVAAFVTTACQPDRPVAAPSATTSATAADATTLQRDADAIRDVGITGVQARLVAADGKSTVVTSGVADTVSRSPVSGEGYFRTASATKTFTATVLLQLVGEGKIALDDTVEKWLPGVVHGNGNDGTKITVRQLLNHTSGLTYPNPYELASPEDFHRYALTTPPPADQVVAAAVQSPPNFAPGSGWSYSNTGYLLAGMIIEKVTDTPWYEEVDHRIITPLGLAHTSYPGSAVTVPAPHATGYTQWPTGGLVDTTDNRIGVFAAAAGALITTTADLNTFFRALLGGKLLRPEQLAEMKTTVDTDPEVKSIFPGARYGLGLFSIELSCGGRYWMHGGDIPGYKTRDGVTDDGTRSVVVSMSTLLQDTEDHQIAQENTAMALVDHALCRTGNSTTR
ncbi:beta-lactamase family protein [Nocardia yamanashiensis]|uniref:serine hydrolase domain-containing protein n=1 Tax=Nocardia yamanashiensis TaxID=209247 RepID=UPI001E4CB1D4|nr:serine hydrolase domain-containing protein [Nocardia yamanashiensis]UGT44318.1 beta-lactamase family protein [Nocardia yamanashiensis]